MKILIVSGGYLSIPAVQGGAVETLINLYIDENENKYHDDIDLISVPVPDNLKYKIKEYKYTNFIYLKNKSKNSIYNLYSRALKKFGICIGDYYINKIIKTIKKMNKEYDFIICENIPFYAVLLKKNFNSKIILHLHNDVLNNQMILYKKIIKNCDYIFAVSNYIKKRINCPQKCITTYNGIDFSLFEKKIKNKDENGKILMKKYNINENDFVYIFIGRLVAYKGISELIDAFLLLNKKYNNVKLIVIGSPYFSAKLKNNFSIRLEQKKNENIIFTGYINNDELYKYYNISDVQITPSIFEEPFGLTVIEALAMDKRVIVSDAGALPEIVPQKYGTIVSRDDLVNNLCKAMEKEYLERKKNKNCINELKQFSKEEYAKRLHDNLVLINNESNGSDKT